MVARVVLVVVSLLVVGGCKPVGDTAESGWSEFDCPRGLTRPFSVQTLIRVGNVNGVSLKRDPSCTGGIGQRDVDEASNIVIGDDVQDDEEVDAREGTVICSVEDRPLDKPPYRVSRHKWPDDQETYFRLANLECAIYPSDPGQITQLANTFRALAAAPTEKRSCPRAHPTPVSLARLMRIAKDHRLRLQRDYRCIEPGVVAQASTFLPYDHASILNLDTILQEQGAVTCLVRKTAHPGAEALRTTSLSVGNRFDHHNVTCTVEPYNVSLYPEISAKQVARVRATMEALK